MDAENKAIQIFNFVKALNELKYPVSKDMHSYDWKLYLDEVPNYKTISIGQPFNSLLFNYDENDEYILKIGRPILTSCPIIPEVLLDWIIGNWNNPSDVIGKVSEKSETILGDGEEITIQINFDDSKDRISAFEKWNTLREEWRKTEVKARAAFDLYERVYSLYSRLNREGDSFEIVLGDGFFYSFTGGVEHPVLLLRLQIEFDANLPEFKIVSSDKPTELYSRLLRQLQDINTSRISEFAKNIEEEQLSPFYGEVIDSLLIEMVHTFDGKYLKDYKRIEKNKNELITYRRPVFFIRKRESGYIEAINRIIENVKNDGFIPSSITNITGISTADRETSIVIDIDSIEAKLFRVNGISKDVLFSKPAKEEQLLIAQKINAVNSVMVQGPPGTGKTHTIANLIGHFMALGKNVLVTSYSAKALKVLKGFLPESLQPLCISLIDESKQQLSDAINSINFHLTKDNPVTLSRRGTEIENKRNNILSNLLKAKKDLAAIVNSEYTPIIFEGKEYSPKEAAVFVKNNKENLSWIPGEVYPMSSTPLSIEEIEELYLTNEKLNIDDEKELSITIPRIDNLITPAKFNEYITLIKGGSNFDSGLKFWNSNAARTSKCLTELLDIIEQSKGLFIEIKEWQLSALFAGKNKTLYYEPWDNLFCSVDELLEMGARISNYSIEYDIFVPEELISELTENVLDEIIQKTGNGKGVSNFTLIFKKEWKRIIDSCSINNMRPSGGKDFELIKSKCCYRRKQQMLLSRFKKLIVNSSELNIQPSSRVELAINEFRPKLKKYLDWHENIWVQIVKSLVDIGFFWDDYNDILPAVASQYGDVEKIIKVVTTGLPDLITAEICRCIIEENKVLFSAYEETLNSYDKSPIVAKLKYAIENGDVVTYEIAYKRVIELQELLPTHNRRCELINKIGEKAPKWAHVIKSRTGIHSKAEAPFSPLSAWLWSQLNQELDRRASLNIKNVQHSIDNLNEQLMSTTEELINAKAWLAEITSISGLKKSQALKGWAQMVNLGSGKGKRAKILIEQAKEQMKICQSAVPVWVMPLNKVVENFIPGETKFDIIIVDEASQVDITGLIALYFGEKVIVVGDDKQVSPVSVGIEVTTIQQLQHEFLDGVSNAPLYNELLSLYDMANWSFEPIRLREHFRCATPIIQFSNHYYYNNDIKPMRDTSLVKTKPHTVAYRVEGVRDGGMRNPVEADMIVALIKSCLERPEYKDATIGVISVLGQEQALLIDEKLRRSLDEAVYDKHKVLCGNPPQFQGDQRDIVFISIVDSPGDTGGPLPLKREGFFEINAKRYNVAASRAKDQLWVVYSLNPDIDLKPDDIRGRLIHHAINPDAIEALLEKNFQKAESEFEKLVIKALTIKGYKVFPQWKVGAYRLDIVVEYQGRRIAIECDGEKYHGSDKLLDDMSRQSILERCGWRFIRIRGSQFFRDHEKTMQKVFTELDEREIFPVPIDDESSSDEDHVLKDKIIERANVIIEDDLKKPISEITLAPRKTRPFQKKGKTIITQKPESVIESEEISHKPEANLPKNVNKPVPLPQMNVIQKQKQATNVVKQLTISDFSEIKNNKFDIASYLTNKGIEIIDHRKSGNIIWAIGNDSLADELSSLKQKGYNFIYY